MTSSLAIHRCTLSDVFSTIFLFLTFLNIHIYFNILKTYDQQFTLTTKNHCISSLKFETWNMAGNVCTVESYHMNKFCSQWTKVTIIWAPQSGTSTEIVGWECHIREPSGIQLEGLGERRELPQQGPGQSPGCQQFFRIYIIQYSYGEIAQFVNVGTNPGHQAKNGTNGHPRRTVIFFGDMSSKIRTVPENPGWMVTLLWTHFEGNTGGGLNF